MILWFFKYERKYINVVNKFVFFDIFNDALENVRISVFILKVPILQPYGNNSTSGFFFLRIVFVCSQNGHHL
jgi:hypothetical protein